MKQITDIISETSFGESRVGFFSGDQLIECWIEKNQSSKVIYHIDRDLVYWYSSDKNCVNFDIINHPCYIKTKDKAYLGIVLSHNPKTHNITFADIQPKFKEHKVKATHCYPITSQSYLKYTTAIKIDNSL